MSTASESGLGQPEKKPVVDKGDMDTNDLAAAILRMDESSGTQEAKAEGDAEAPEETVVDEAAEAVEETTEVPSQGETEEAASEPAPVDAELEYPKFKKRVDTLTAQKKEAQEKIAELEGQLNELRNAPRAEAEPVAPASANPFQHVTSAVELQREEASAENVIEWCDANDDGAVVKQADGTEREYTSKEVRDVRRSAEKAIRKYIPSQHEYIKAREHYDQQAVAIYPWWKDKSTAEYQHASNIMRVFPEVGRFPDYKLSIGDFVAGFKARSAQAKTAVVLKKAPAQPTATSRPAPVEPTKARSDAALNRFNRTGKVEDLAKLLSHSKV